METNGNKGSVLGAVSTALGLAQGALDSKQYLVEGAKLFCVNGSEITQLKIPENHNYTSGGKIKANCKDCKACDNIPYFGECGKNEDTHQCEGFIDLEEKWENTAVTTSKSENISGEDAIGMSSVLLCKKGGIIIPVTSGQGYDGAIDWAAFLLRYQNVVRWAAGKNLLCHVFGHDPINMNTGNYVYENEDLVISGVIPVSFHLFYNAMACGNQGILGEGWSHNYGVHLKKIVEEELLGIVLEDGREVPYSRRLEYEYEAVMGDEGTLKKFHNGYTYEINEIVYEFDNRGKLKKQIDRNNNFLLFKYNSKGLLVFVDNGNGSQLHYTYNEEKRLIQVEDHSGRKISLKYQYGKLRWFTNSSGNTYVYEYNENGKLDGVITPRGIKGVKNDYDGANRVIKQTLPDGGVMELRYDDKNNRTYMKEQNGNLIVYECDEKLRNIRTIYEDGEEKFAYNDRNHKIRYTDKNGNTTRYSYDNRGNLTQVINALGEKKCITYDAKNHLIKVKLPDDGQIKFFYDEQGNLIKTVNQLEYSYSMEYDDKNRIIRIILPDNSRINYDFDERGNIISVINPFEGQTSYEYDDLNQIVKMTDSNHYATEYSYDLMGNLTGIVNSDGKRLDYKYNTSGSIISVSNFDETIQLIEYNACNKPCKYEDQ